MISQAWLQWALTVCFTATGAWSTLEVVVDRVVTARIGHAFHALMSAGMVAMVWPWGESLAPAAQGALFLVATGWFAAVAVHGLRNRPQLRPQLRHPWWHQPYHALMMAAMAWMVLAMMPMAGGGGHEHHHALPLWSALLGVVFLVVMLAGTAVFAVDAAAALAARARWCGPENVNHAAMSLGMAAMIVPMVAA